LRGLGAAFDGLYQVLVGIHKPWKIGQHSAAFQARLFTVLIAPFVKPDFVPTNF